MKVDQAVRLLEIAKRISKQDPDFQAVKGPGKGNQATNTFLAIVREQASIQFGEDFSEQRICGNTSQAVDFYFSLQGTIVEIALGLPNPASEFKEDVLKAIMARENGYNVDRLFFISRPGAIKKCTQPGRSAISEWLKTQHGISVEIHELDGTPRKRIRRSAINV